jgi:hypothetical protein
MNIRRLLRAVVVLAVLLLGSALGGSASARSTMTVPLVEHWDGTSWSQVAVPSIQYGLDAVAAPSATDVWAFGVSQVAEHWNGTSWQRVSLPVPKGYAAPMFLAASAASPDDVWALGEGSPASGPAQAIIDHWNGQRWQIVPYPRTGKYSLLQGVTALSAKDVWAVGYAGVVTANGLERLTLTLHWNGTAWKRVTSPNPATFTTPAGSVDNALTAVAGSSSRSVWAVGQYYLQANGTHGSRALTLHWNGSSWKVVPNPDLVAQHPSYLYGVTAPSANGVSTVGSINRNGAQHALAERWNGKGWSVTHTPGPRLTGVSGLATNDAWAAGGPDGPGRVMHWNGNAWTVSTKLARSDGLNAVAEVSPTDVWAVGGRVKH